MSVHDIHPDGSQCSKVMTRLSIQFIAYDQRDGELEDDVAIVQLNRSVGVMEYKFKPACFPPVRKDWDNEEGVAAEDRH